MAGERILIVEDEVALEGRPLEIELKNAGYDVVGIAEDEAGAVELALRERPSVVLMDIKLVNSQGGPDPFAGLRAAQRIHSAVGSQIIFTTSTLGDPDVLAEAKKSAAYQFLVKPVAISQLLISIQMAVARVKRKNVVFVSYSHGDTRLAKEMMQHLNGLRGLGIRPWIDTQIAPSQNWKKQIDTALAEASAAICLISSGFIDSRFITTVELPSLLKSEAANGLRVYPVFVNYVYETILKPLGLLDFQGVNRPNDPIASWPTAKRHQECWGELCKWLSSTSASTVE